MSEKNLMANFLSDVNRVRSIRRYFRGWFVGTSVFASGLMLSYIFFSDIFGSLYSVKTMVTLGVNGLNNPFPLISFILRFYVIYYFAIPLGFMFMALRRGRDKGRFFTLTVSGLVLFSCLLGVFSFSHDSSIVLSLIGFTAIVLLMLMDIDRTPYHKEREIINFGRALVIFYSVYVVFLFLLNSPSLEITSFNQLQSFLWTLLSIQSVSMPLALITAPIVIGISHKQKPDEIWFAFISAILLFVFTQTTQLYLESAFFIVLIFLLLYAYGKESLEFYTVKDIVEPKQIASPSNPNQPRESFFDTNLFSSLIDKIMAYKGTADFVNSLNRLMKEVTVYLEVQAQEKINKANQENNVTEKLSRPLYILADEASKSLNKIADEASLFRELRTGEVLKVKRLEEYVPPIKRIVEIQGVQKSAGVKHYLICSRTGHGKTTLMKNFMKFHGDFAYFVVDRHSEYSGIIDSSEVIVLDKVIDISELDRILSQIPRTELTTDRSLLREAQVFSLEQQFNFAVDRLLSESFVEDVANKLFKGQSIILQPGTVPEMIYTRITHDIIGKIFERKMKGKMQQGLVFVNEEAHNSFEVNEEGMERNKAHVLIKIVMEGRKYNTSLINISSDPENIPKNIKDNSILILGSIGTPAIKKLVGEKLGMIYIRYIHEIPIGYFFIDEAGEDGNYIVFPNHFGSSEGMKILAV